MISGRTRVFGLVGHPVRHSLSPELHNALFRRLGMDAVYVAFDVDPRRAAGVADAIRTLDVVGVNLTVPFKEAVLPHLDAVTIAAQEAGACNVVIQLDGHLTGYNTDGEGLARALEEEHTLDPRGRRVVVLGAGGSARAIAAAMAARGAAEVVFCNRRPERAEAACAHLRAQIPGCGFWAAPLDPGGFGPLALQAGLVVNALGAGAEAAVRGLPVDGLPADAIWCDINYWMREPPQLAACAARGLRTSTGLGMLLHQGALSFELFTGTPIEARDLREILAARPLQAGS